VVSYFTQAKAKVCLNDKIKVLLESEKFKVAFFSIMLLMQRKFSASDEMMCDPSRNEQFQEEFYLSISFIIKVRTPFIR